MNPHCVSTAFSAGSVNPKSSSTKTKSLRSVRSFTGLLLATLLLAFGSTAHAAANLYWSNANADSLWATVADWSTVAGANTAPGAIPGSSDTTYFNVTALTTAQSVGLAGTGQSAAGLVFNSTGTTTFTCTTSGTTITLGSGGMTVNPGVGTVAFGGNSGNNFLYFALPTSSQTWLNSSVNAISFGNHCNISLGANTLTFDGTGGFNVQGSSTTSITSGTGGITKNGSGTLTMGQQVSTYSGATTINGGIFNAATIANVNTASSIGKGSSGGSAADLVFGGGTLQHNSANVANSSRLFTIGNASGLTATIDSSSTSAANFVNFTGSGAIATGGSGARTLTLTGTCTGTNTVTPIIADGTGGSTALVKSGAGTWVLNGVNTYTGTTTVSAGTLLVNSPGSLASVSAVTVAAGGTLGGNGTISGSVSLNPGGILIPGSAANTIGTLTLGSTLTLNGNTISFDLPASGTTCDLIAVTGNLVLNGANYITLNAPNGAVPNGTYTLMTFAAKTGSGTLTFPNGLLVMGNATLAINSGNVTLNVGGSGLSYNLDTWSGSASGIWDTSSLNWVKNGAASSAYTAGDAVTFDDSAAGPFTITNVSSVVAVAPTNIFFNNTVHAYVVSNSITTGGIVKNGSAQASLTGTVAGTGALAVNGGTLTLSHGLSGFTSGTVASGATLQVATVSTLPTLTLNGNGSAYSLEFPSGNSTTYTLGGIALSGDVIIRVYGLINSFTLGSAITSSGANSLTFRTEGANTAGQPHTFTLNAASSYTGATTLTAVSQQGILKLGINNALPVTTTLTLNGGGNANNSANLDLNGKSQTLAGLNGTPSTGGSIVYATTAGTLTISNASAYTFSGVIGGNSKPAVTFVKQGAGTQTLSGVNLYTGTTSVGAGTLLVNSPGSLASGSAVTVSNAATLGGNGTINGTVNVLAGGYLAPGGVGAYGVLTLANNSSTSLTLNGNLLQFDLNSVTTPGTTYDQIAISGGSGNLVLNGANVIQLNSPGGTIHAGTYTLMTYAAQTGSGTLTLPNGALTMGNFTLTVGLTSVTLGVSADTTYSALTWTGNVSAAWNGADLNWLNGTTASTFSSSNAVTFDDNGSGASTITSSGTVSPGSVVFNNNTTNYTISATLGAGSLVKNGSASATLSGVNTYGGPVVVNGGTLALSGGTLSGVTGVTVASGATLQPNAATTYASSPTTITGSGSSGNYGNALLFNYNGTGTWPGAITLGSGGANIGVFGTTPATIFTGGISGTGPLTFNGRGGSVITHTANFTLNTTASSYSGNTTINNNDGVKEATLTLGLNNALPIGTALTLNMINNACTVGVTLDLNGQNQQLGGLAKNATGTSTKYRVLNSSGTTSTLTISNATTAYSFDGLIGIASNDQLNLVKLGAATLTLGGANLYAGNTTIGGGTLALSSSGSLAKTPQIAITNGATFDVSANTAGFTFTGSSPVQTLAASSPTGTATITAGTGAAGVTVASSALLSFQADGTGSTVGKISVSGDLNLNTNAITVNVTGSALPVGDYTLMSCTGTLANTGTFATPTITGISLTAGYVASIVVNTGTAGTVVLHVINGSLTTTTMALAQTAGSSPSTYGDSLTFTATLTASDLSTAETGNIVFSTNGVPYQTDAIVTGVATMTTANLPYAASAYAVTAIYVGDSTYSGSSSSPVSQQVNKYTLTLTGATAQNKLVDGGTAAVITGGTLSSTLFSEVVTATTGTFASAGAGAGISVSVNLSGAAAVNYTLTQPGLTATIFANPTWTNTVSGAWETTGNWVSGVMASGSSTNADFSQINPTADVTVSLNAPRTIGSMTFGDTDTTSAAGWTVDSNSTPANIITLAGGTPTITVNALGTGKAATISAPITGSANLNKAGTGTLVLAGPTTLGTSLLNVNAGKLVITNGAAVSAVNTTASGTLQGVAGGATLEINGGSLTTSTYMSVGTSAGTSTFTLTSGGFTNTGEFLTCFTGAGTGVVNINGGVADLNQFSMANGSGQTSTMNLNSGGTVRLNYFHSRNAAATANVNFNGATVVAKSAQTDFIQTNTLLTANVQAGGAIIDSNGNNITNNAALIHDPALAGTPDGGLTKQGSGILGLTATNTFTGGLTIKSGTVSASANTTTLGGAGGTGTVYLGYNGGSANATLLGAAASTYPNPIVVPAGDSGIMTISNASGATVFSGGITMTNALSLNSQATDLNISGAITGTNQITSDSASGSFVNLSAANPSFTGPVLINSGVLRIGVASALSAANTVTLNTGSILDVQNATTIGGLQDGTGSGIVTNRSTTGRTLTLGGSGNYGFSGTIWDGSNGGVNVTALTKSGSGTQTLSGNNSYTGTTTVSGGTLALSGAGSLGSGANLTMSGGTLDLGGLTTPTVGAVSITGPSTIQSGSLTGTSYAASLTTGNAIVSARLLVNGAAGLSKSGAGQLTLSAANTYTGTTTVSAGTLTLAGTSGTINDAGTVQVNNDGTVLDVAQSDTIDTLKFGSGGSAASGAGTLTVTTIILPNIPLGSTNNISVALAGTAQLKKTGQGTTVLSGANSYTGGTWLNGANSKLTISGSGTLGSTSGALLVDTSSAILDLGTTTQTVGTVTNAPGVISNGVLTATSFYCSNSVSYAVLAGSSTPLTVNGPGTTTLYAANTYTGNTTISAGTLALSGAGAIVSTNILVASGATYDVSAVTGGYTLGGTQTLKGNGAVTGAVTVNGTLAPSTATGTGIGTLSFANPLTLAGTASMEINKAGSTTADQAAVTGAITYGGALVVTASGSALAAGDSFTNFTATGGFNGTFSSLTLPSLPGGVSGLAWDTNDLVTNGVLDVYSFVTTNLTLSTASNTLATVTALKLANHVSSAKLTAAYPATGWTAVPVPPANGTATVDGSGNLTYMPNTGYSGGNTDTFNVVFSDGHGTQTLAVSVVVGNSSTGGAGSSPNFLSTGVVGGNFYANFAGLPSTTYTVEYTDTLNPANWQKLGSTNVTSTATGVIQILDPTGATAPHRYYRTVYPSY